MQATSIFCLLFGATNQRIPGIMLSVLFVLPSDACWLVPVSFVAVVPSFHWFLCVWHHINVAVTNRVFIFNLKFEVVLSLFDFLETIRRTLPKPLVCSWLQNKQSSCINRKHWLMLHTVFQHKHHHKLTTFKFWTSRKKNPYVWRNARFRKRVQISG
jgi:hypothetical protein